MPDTFTFKCLLFCTVFPCGSAGKESDCNAGDLGLIPGLGRSPGEGKGYPLQYSGLEKPSDYTVHGVAKSLDVTDRLSLHFRYFAYIRKYIISFEFHKIPEKSSFPEKNTMTQRLSDLSIWSHNLPKTR